MNKEKPISVTYGGVEIVYVEGTNKWQFTLRGRERSTESLENAKIAIAKPPPANKKPFEKTEAYQDDWDGRDHGYIKVTITSIAEKTYYGSEPRFWISRPGKSRVQADKTKLFAVTPENESRIAAIQKMRKQIDGLEKSVKTEQRLLKPVEIDTAPEEKDAP